MKESQISGEYDYFVEETSSDRTTEDTASSSVSDKSTCTDTSSVCEGASLVNSHDTPSDSADHVSREADTANGHAQSTTSQSRASLASKLKASRHSKEVRRQIGIKDRLMQRTFDRVSTNREGLHRGSEEKCVEPRKQFAARSKRILKDFGLDKKREFRDRINLSLAASGRASKSSRERVRTSGGPRAPANVKFSQVNDSAGKIKAAKSDVQMPKVVRKTNSRSRYPPISEQKGKIDKPGNDLRPTTDKNTTNNAKGKPRNDQFRRRRLSGSTPAQENNQSHRRRSATSPGVSLPSPEIIETYPGGRLAYMMHAPIRQQANALNLKNGKVIMISKSDDHLTATDRPACRKVKSTRHLKVDVREGTPRPPEMKLSEGAVTIQERAKSLQKEIKKMRGETELAAFNASSDTKIAKKKHHDPARRMSFMRALKEGDHRRNLLRKGFMTTVGKVVPNDHSIVLIGQAQMKNGERVKTVVLGTLLVEEKNIGSGDSILKLAKKQKDLITGKVSLSSLPQKRNQKATGILWKSNGLENNKEPGRVGAKANQSKEPDARKDNKWTNPFRLNKDSDFSSVENNSTASQNRKDKASKLLFPFGRDHKTTQNKAPESTLSGGGTHTAASKMSRSTTPKGREHVAAGNTRKEPTKKASASAVDKKRQNIREESTLPPIRENASRGKNALPNPAEKESAGKDDKKGKVYRSTFFMFMGKSKKRQEEKQIVEEEIVENEVDVQHAEVVQQDQFSEDSDIEADESVLKTDAGQTFTIGRDGRPRQVTKDGKVCRKNILWRVPSGHGARDANCGRTLQRKMKGIRLDIRRTTDVSSQNWAKGKSQVGLKAKKSSSRNLAQSRSLDIMSIDSDQMSEIRDALMGDPYAFEDMSGTFQARRDKNGLLYLRGDANLYDYIASSKSAHSSMLHQALSGVLYIGTRLRGAIKKRKPPTRSRDYEEISGSRVESNLKSTPQETVEESPSSFDECSDSDDSEAESNESGPSHTYDAIESTEHSRQEEQETDAKTSDIPSYDSVHTGSPSYDSVHTTDSFESSSEGNKSTLTPSIGVHSKLFTAVKKCSLPPSVGIRILPPDQKVRDYSAQIVIGRRGHNGKNLELPRRKVMFVPNAEAPVTNKTVRLSSSCDTIYKPRLSTTLLRPVGKYRRGMKCLTNRHQRLIPPPPPRKSQSFHSYFLTANLQQSKASEFISKFGVDGYNHSVEKTEPFQKVATTPSRSSKQRGLSRLRDYSDKGCGDSVYRESGSNPSSKGLKTSSISTMTGSTVSGVVTGRRDHLKPIAPKISARTSSRPQKSHGNNPGMGRITSIIRGSSNDADSSISTLPDSSTDQPSRSSSVSSGTTYSRHLTATSTAMDGYSTTNIESDITESCEGSSEQLSIIQGDIEPITEFNASQIIPRMNGSSDDNEELLSSASSVNSGEELLSETTDIDQESAPANLEISADYIEHCKVKSTYLQPSCNSEFSSKIPQTMDMDNRVEEYSVPSNYLSDASIHKPDSWVVSENSTNGIPMPVVADERLHDFSTSSSDRTESVDECSAVATAGLKKRGRKGARPIQKIRQLLKYLRGDTLIFKAVTEKNNITIDEDVKLPSAECCMKAQTSPFDFSGIYTDNSPKCGCIKRFEPFFEKLYEQNAYVPLAKRIVDLSMYEGLEIHGQLHPLYTEKDVDIFCDKLVYEALSKGVAQFSVLQSLSSTLLEIESEDMLDNMMVTDVQGVVEEMVANVITEEAMQQGRRSLIVQSFINDSVPKVSARKSNDPKLRAMYRVALRNAVIEEIDDSKSLLATPKASTVASNLSDTTVVLDVSSKSLVNGVPATSISKSLTFEKEVSKSRMDLVASKTSLSQSRSNISSETATNDSAPNPSSRWDAKPQIPASKPGQDDSIGITSSNQDKFDWMTACIADTSDLEINYQHICEVEKNDKGIEMKSNKISESKGNKKSTDNHNPHIENMGTESLSPSCAPLEVPDGSTLKSNEVVEDTELIGATKSSESDAKISSKRDSPTEHQTDVMTNEEPTNNGVRDSEPLTSLSRTRTHGNCPLPSDVNCDGTTVDSASSVEGNGNPIIAKSVDMIAIVGNSSSSLLATETGVEEIENINTIVSKSTNHDISKTTDVKTIPRTRSNIDSNKEQSTNSSETTISAKPSSRKDDNDKFGERPTSMEIASESGGTSEAVRIGTGFGKKSNNNRASGFKFHIGSARTTERARRKSFPGTRIGRLTHIENSTGTVLNRSNIPAIQQSFVTDANNSTAVPARPCGISQDWKVPPTIDDNNEVSIPRSSSSRLMSHHKASKINRTCGHAKIFLSCIQCRRAIFKSSISLRNRSSFRKRSRRLKERGYVSYDKPKGNEVRYTHAVNITTPFPSGGIFPCNDTHTNIHTHHSHSDSIPQYSSSSMGTSVYDEYGSSHRSLSSGSTTSCIFTGGQVVIGRTSKKKDLYIDHMNSGRSPIQIAMKKLAPEPNIHCMYSATPSNFPDCGQRIVIGRENTPDDVSARGVKCEKPSTHPCGCSKPTGKSPRSDCELDDEKIVEKVRRMFRSHSPRSGGKNSNDKLSRDGTEIQEHSKITCIDKADASVQTSARRGYDFSSDRESTVSSSDDQEGYVQSPSARGVTKKTRPLQSTRSTSTISESSRGECSSSSRSAESHSSNSQTLPRVANKPNSVLDIFDELKQELSELGSIIDTSKVRKNRDAGILGDAIPRLNIQSATEIGALNDLVAVSKQSHGTSTQQVDEPTSSPVSDVDTQNIESKSISKNRKISFAAMFGKPQATCKDELAGSRTHGEIDSKSHNVGISASRNMFDLLKQIPLVSGTPSSTRRRKLSQIDSSDDGPPPKVMSSSSGQEQENISRRGISVVSSSNMSRKSSVQAGVDAKHQLPVAELKEYFERDRSAQRKSLRRRVSVGLPNRRDSISRTSAIVDKSESQISQQKNDRTKSLPAGKLVKMSAVSLQQSNSAPLGNRNQNLVRQSFKSDNGGSMVIVGTERNRKQSQNTSTDSVVSERDYADEPNDDDDNSYASTTPTNGDKERKKSSIVKNELPGRRRSNRSPTVDENAANDHEKTGRSSSVKYHEEPYQIQANRANSLARNEIPGHIQSRYASSTGRNENPDGFQLNCLITENQITTVQLNKVKQSDPPIVLQDHGKPSHCRAIAGNQMCNQINPRRNSSIPWCEVPDTVTKRRDTKSGQDYVPIDAQYRRKSSIARNKPSDPADPTNGGSPDEIEELEHSGSRRKSSLRRSEQVKQRTKSSIGRNEIPDHISSKRKSSAGKGGSHLETRRSSSIRRGELTDHAKHRIDSSIGGDDGTEHVSPRRKSSAGRNGIPDQVKSRHRSSINNGVYFPEKHRPSSSVGRVETSHNAHRTHSSISNNSAESKESLSEPEAINRTTSRHNSSARTRDREITTEISQSTLGNTAATDSDQTGSSADTESTGSSTREVTKYGKTRHHPHVSTGKSSATSQSSESTQGGAPYHNERTKGKKGTNKRFVAASLVESSAESSLSDNPTQQPHSTRNKRRAKSVSYSRDITAGRSVVSKPSRRSDTDTTNSSSNIVAKVYDMDDIASRSSRKLSVVPSDSKRKRKHSQRLHGGPETVICSQTSTDESSDCLESTESGKTQKRERSRRRCKRRRSKCRNSSFTDALCSLFTLHDDIRIDGFETVIRIGALFIIVMYAMHEEIFNYDGNFPT